MEKKPTLTIHEFFTKLQNIEDRDQRVAALRKHAYKQIKTVLQLAYNDNVELDLPEGAPPYRPNPEKNFPISRMSSVFRTIGYCVKGNKCSQIRKEKWFISILEQLHPEDAKILIAAKDGKLHTFSFKKYSKITKVLVKDALPEILK